MERGAWRREPGGVRVVRRAPDHLRPDPGVNHPATNTSAPVSPTPRHTTHLPFTTAALPAVNPLRPLFH